MKLKTLKDLEKELEFNEGYEFEVFDEIRKEAIKWVKDKKEVIKDWNEFDNDKWDKGYTHGFASMLSNFEEFFNITEEDLK